jgi:DnaJ-class molecular chaperone
MDAIGSGVVFLILMVVAVFVMSRFMGGPRMVCTRCQGTGQVDERWPDPSKPGGWHKLEGKCPKCKGKGKV